MTPFWYTPLMVLGTAMFRTRYNATGNELTGPRDGIRNPSVTNEMLVKAARYCDQRWGHFRRQKQNHRARSGAKFYARWSRIIWNERERRASHA